MVTPGKSCWRGAAARVIGQLALVLVAVLVWRPATADLLTDRQYAVGAKSRMDQFIRRGADPKEAEAIFRRLTDLEPQRWVDEWTRLAEPWERQAAELEAAGKMQEANEAYRMAYVYYSIAKFPVLNHPAKQQAYRKCIENYLKAARAFDPPLERVTIPFEGKQIIGYLRKPKGVAKPPVVIATGGIDNYKEDRNLSDFLGVGLAAFSMDMPGAGESPVWYTPDGDRLYSAAIDHLAARPDLDGQRIGIVGRSYGGYWGARMAFVEPERIKAAVQWGGPVHHSFQESYIRQELLTDKLYLWPVVEAMMYAHHVNSLDELYREAPKMSLKTLGYLDRPAAPLLGINGAHDPWMTVQDVYVLLEGGEPKAGRVFADGGHMGRTDNPGRFTAGEVVMNWVKMHLQ